MTITVVAMDRSHNVTKSSWEMKRDTSANGETVQPVEGAGDETDPGQEDAGLQEGGEETTEETENSDPEEQAIAAREEQIAALSDEAPRFYLKQHQVTVEKMASLTDCPGWRKFQMMQMTGTVCFAISKWKARWTCRRKGHMNLPIL